MRVAVVGLGRMGGPIAERLLAAGHELTVFNRTQERAAPLVERGARLAESLAAVWKTADVAITTVSDDEALRAVALGSEGLAAPGRDGRVLVDMSTVGLEVSRAVGEAAGAAGVGYLRAPVSGNPSVVRAGNLTIVASGDRAVFEATEPLLRDVGPNVFHVGEGDEARVLKLALNLILAGTAELLAEAIALGEANGLERETMLEVVGASAVGSPFVKYKTAPLVARDYASTFTTTQMAKDVDLALRTGMESGVPLPATALMRNLLDATAGDGMAELDFMALLPRLQREAGRPVDV